MLRTQEVFLTLLYLDPPCDKLGLVMLLSMISAATLRSICICEKPLCMLSARLFVRDMQALYLSLM